MQRLRHKLSQSLSLALATLLGSGLSLAAGTPVDLESLDIGDLNVGDWGGGTMGEIVGESGGARPLAAGHVSQISQETSRCHYVAIETFGLSTSFGSARTSGPEDQQNLQNHFVVIPKRSGVVRSGVSSCEEPNSALWASEREPYGNPRPAGLARGECLQTVRFRPGVDSDVTEAVFLARASDFPVCLRLKYFRRDKLSIFDACYPRSWCSPGSLNEPGSSWDELKGRGVAAQQPLSLARVGRLSPLGVAPPVRGESTHRLLSNRAWRSR